MNGWRPQPSPVSSRSEAPASQALVFATGVVAAYRREPARSLFAGSFAAKRVRNRLYSSSAFSRA